MSGNRRLGELSADNFRKMNRKLEIITADSAVSGSPKTCPKNERGFQHFAPVSEDCGRFDLPTTSCREPAHMHPITTSNPPPAAGSCQYPVAILLKPSVLRCNFKVLSFSCVRSPLSPSQEAHWSLQSRPASPQSLLSPARAALPSTLPVRY